MVLNIKLNVKMCIAMKATARGKLGRGFKNHSGMNEIMRVKTKAMNSEVMCYLSSLRED